MYLQQWAPLNRHNFQNVLQYIQPILTTFHIFFSYSYIPVLIISSLRFIQVSKIDGFIALLGHPSLCILNKLSTLGVPKQSPIQDHTTSDFPCFR